MPRAPWGRGLGAAEPKEPTAWDRPSPGGWGDSEENTEPEVRI